MADSPLLSAPEPPQNINERFDWLEDRSQELEAVLVRDIRRIVRASIERFIATLPPDPPESLLAGGGDFTEFDDIVTEWDQAVDRNVRPVVQRNYLAGGVSASISSPGFAGADVETAMRWVPVVNQQAIAYAASRLPILSDIGFAIKTQISTLVSDAVRTGISTEKLAVQIRDVTGASDYRALTIARTEVNAAYANGNRESLDAMDAEFRPVEKYWITSIDGIERESHRNMHLATHARPLPWSQPYEFADGTMMNTHDFSGPASEVINCRCADGELYLGMTRPSGGRAGIDPL